MRRGESSKVTMAQGDINMAGESSGEPWMPHIVLSSHELDKRFPPLLVPGEEELKDHADEADDPILQKGMHIAEEIIREMTVTGRTRTTPTTGAPWEKR